MKQDEWYMKDMATDQDDRGKVHIQLLGRFAVKVGEEAIPEGAWHSQAIACTANR